MMENRDEVPPDFFVKKVDDKVYAWRGESKRDNWKPLHYVYAMRNAKERRRKIGDFPYHGVAKPFFSKRAIAALRPMLEEAGELLDVYVEGKIGEFYLLNVTKVIDVLDLEKSYIKTWTPEEVGMQEKLVFKKFDEVNNAIFRLKGKEESAIYCTQTFIDAVNQAKLEGFWFPKVWGSES